jgi:hypothetical protein
LRRSRYLPAASALEVVRNSLKTPHLWLGSSKHRESILPLSKLIE